MADEPDAQQVKAPPALGAVGVGVGGKSRATWLEHLTSRFRAPVSEGVAGEQQTQPARPENRRPEILAAPAVERPVEKPTIGARLMASARVAVKKIADAAENLAPVVRRRLDAAEAAAAKLDAQVDEISLAVALEQPGSTEAQAELEAKREAAQAEVRRLRGALRLAERRDAAERHAAEVRVLRAQVDALRKLTDDRLAAATSIVAGIDQATRGLREYVLLTRRMPAAAPSGVPWPAGLTAGSIEVRVGGLGYPSDIFAAVALEAFRLGGEDGLRLPGASAPPALQNDPQKIEPLTEGLARLHEAIVRHFDALIDAREGQKEAA